MHERVALMHVELMQLDSYPIPLTFERAQALQKYVDALWDAVPDDDKLFLNGHYRDLSAALMHREFRPK